MFWITAGGVLIAAGLFAGRRKIGAAATMVSNTIKAAFNDSKLDDLTPAARERFQNFLADVQNKLGYSALITSGYRTQAYQERLRKQNSRAVSPGTSPHVYGIAIDANFTKDGKTLKMNSSNAEWEASGIPALARQHNLRWGGDFNSPDRVHFDTGWSKEIALRKLAEAKARFGENAWYYADLRKLA